MFRVFGSPFTLILHQQVTYLRLKQVPFKVYCTSLTTSLIYALIYGARNAFCVLTPSGVSRLQVWQAAEAAELDEDLAAVVGKSGRKGDIQYVTNKGVPLQQAQRMLVNKRTHPRIHLACWATVLYACWWLPKTGAAYRWVLGEGLDVMEGYLRYFLFGTFPGFGLARGLAPKLREVMARIVLPTGVSKMTAPFMDEHFHRMCAALERHFSSPDHKGPFLLDTPHPTLADVTLGAVFSSSFLTDDPPASTVAERYPHLLEYVEQITGWKGGVFVGDKAPGADTEKTDEPGRGGGDGTHTSEKDTTCEHTRERKGDYPDTVPETLADFFAVVAEVFPFMMSQCASFNAYMSSDAIRTLKREPLEEPWKGCNGYLFPPMTNVKALMIVDNNVLSIQARAQDLEIAFMASQEVTDDELDDFGRAPRATSSSAETDALHANARVEAGMEAAKVRATHLLQNVTLHDSDGPETSAPATELLAPQAAGAVQDAADTSQTTTDTRRSRGSVLIHNPTDVHEADEADFYQVFTVDGGRRYGTVSLRRNAIVSRRDKSGHGELSDAASAAPSVYDRLQVLRDMMTKMRCPQYTLSSIFIGKRIHVAAIPEYEVAKVRAERASRKRSGCQQ